MQSIECNDVNRSTPKIHHMNRGFLGQVLPFPGDVFVTSAQH